jgi:protein-tyrosine phosphatase
LRRFDPALGDRPRASDLDVPDPYYDGSAAFAEVLGLVEAACAGLLDHVRGELDDRPVRAG